jgi:outer membrane receptor protein involved in Fe transport
VTNRLAGDFTVESAINRLLEGTGLIPVFSDDGLQTITIKIETNQMNFRKKSGLFGMLLAVLGGTADLAVAQQDDSQEDGSQAQNRTLEEIIITGRNREETLQDIPVSTSVISDTLIDDAGISSLYDLFELVPGLHYDEQVDRTGAQPSIRGVQSNEIATNRTKVTAFIDGIPVLGSQGSIGFNSFKQVEVYRGPQSAAFGRSTFAGAINYLTKDPGETLEANIGIDVSDFGTRILEGSVGGPITDTFGVLVQFQHEDSSSPSEWHANGAYTAVKADEALRADLIETTNIGLTDGTEFGARSGDNVSAKFVFAPSDSFSADLTFAHTETQDSRNPILYPTEEARNACFNDRGLRADQGMSSIWINGEMDCDWDNFRESYANHDIEEYLRNNPILLDTRVADAVAAGAAPQEIQGELLSVEEQILMVARAYSIPEDDRGSSSERDRVTLQTDWVADNGGALQFSLMYSEETYNRLADGNALYYDPDNYGLFEDGETSDGVGPEIVWNGTDWDHLGGMGPPNAISASPAEIEENYVELRWVSPAEDRLTYVVGASYYDYDFTEERYAPLGSRIETVGYGALLNGIVPEFEQLTGLTFAPDDSILSESATNTSVYFNVGYNLNDKVTLSAEGRYQSDKVGGKNNETGLSAEETTKSFLPRFAITYNIGDDSTVYLQWSRGVNPAGINVGMLDEGVIASLQSGVANALIPYDASYDVDSDSDGYIDDYDLDNGFATLTGESYDVSFDAATFRSYQEEQLTNIEFGFKGSLLDGQLTYSGAIYSIDWKDQLQSGTISWGSPCADGDLVGLESTSPGYLGNCTYEGAEYFYVDDIQDTGVSGVGLNYGDVKIKGIELETAYQLSDSWNLRSTMSYLEAKYDSYCDIALYELRLDANSDYAEALNIDVLEPGADATISSECYIADGNEVASQPKLTLSLSPSYNTSVAGLNFNARMDLRYEDKRWRDSGNFTAFSATTTVNMSMTLSSNAWAATFYVNNLTDENTPRFVTSAGDSAYNLGQISDTPVRDFTGTEYSISRDNFQFTPRIPRTIGMRLNYSF